MVNNKKKLKVIPLGGLGEIGKNMTVFEYGNDIIVVDCGIAFPSDEMLGIDLVLPDITYLRNNKNKIRGIILTHGHEDHIGGIPFVLRDINVPVFGTRLALGLLEVKLEEHKMLRETSLNTIEQGQSINLGVFKIEFISTCHSIADSVALAIHTPVGVVVHTSDFKIDFTPIQGVPMDLEKLARLGREGVLLLMSDSTNAEHEGYTMSEKTVGESFEKLFANVNGRIIVATFASHIHRVQQVVNAAVKYNRKVALSGRSMVNVASVAMKLGYLTVPEGILIDINDYHKYKPESLMIITTGSQGEPLSALTRMAVGTHRQLQIIPGDLVVISATPIPGNEKPVSSVINELFRRGANVIYSALEDVHVSGHACQEELKLMYSLVKPKYFMPVHGEYRHLMHHTQLMRTLGMPNENTFIMDIGNVLELNDSSAKIAGNVASGKIFVDGLGVGDVGNVVLRDRKLLSQDGMIIVIVTIERESGAITSEPDIISRGFVYIRESEALIAELRKMTYNALSEYNGRDWATMKFMVKDLLSEYLYANLKRNPMILPVIIEV